QGLKIRPKLRCQCPLVAIMQQALHDQTHRRQRRSELVCPDREELLARAHRLEQLRLELFSLGNVDTRADIAGKGPIGKPARDPLIENPTILSIVAAEPVLHLERPAPIEGVQIGVYALLEVLEVHALGPSYVELVGQLAPGESQPALIEK